MINLFVSANAMASPDTISVAVASNFVSPMQAIKARFENEVIKGTNSKLPKLTLSFASSGKLYAQIRNGAPYDLFLSADVDKPQRLIDEGLAIASSRFTFAIGTLVLWSHNADSPEAAKKRLMDGKFNKLAIANPKLAPYGKAALQVVEQLGIKSVINNKKIIKGENISQAYQFVRSGNAQLGFIALSQIKAAENTALGATWLVDKSLYTPIRQDAVLLSKSKDHNAAKQLLRYLRSKEIKKLISSFGYSVE